MEEGELLIPNYHKQVYQCDYEELFRQTVLFNVHLKYYAQINYILVVSIELLLDTRS